MSTALRMLKEFGGGGGGSDFWRPDKNGGKYFLRLYRFGGGEEDEGEKQLCVPRLVHWNVAPKGPIDCTGATCDACLTCSRLRASGSKEDKEKARRISQKRSALFTMVNQDDPTGFKPWDAPMTAAQGVFAQVAKAGGRMGADYPGSKATEEEWTEFGTFFEAGLEKVCGPEGRDIYVVYNPSNPPATKYSIDMRTEGNKALPFPEDAMVLDPRDVLKRMAAKKAEEAGGGA